MDFDFGLISYKKLNIYLFIKMLEDYLLKYRKLTLFLTSYQLKL